MEAFVHLYLGHLFGDYVLQNGWIAKNKAKSKLVLLVHVSLVTISHMLFAFGKNFGWIQILSILAIGSIHYGVDLMKIKIGSSGWVYYVLDQAIHVAVITAFYNFFTRVDFWLPEWISVRLTFSIFNAYLIGILFHMVFNSGWYRRDRIGYILRAAFPWVGNMWMVLLTFVVGLWICKKTYGWRKDVIWSISTSAVLTIIWEVFL